MVTKSVVKENDHAFFIVERTDLVRTVQICIVAEHRNPFIPAGQSIEVMGGIAGNGVSISPFFRIRFPDIGGTEESFRQPFVIALA